MFLSTVRNSQRSEIVGLTEMDVRILQKGALFVLKFGNFCGFTQSRTFLESDPMNTFGTYIIRERYLERFLVLTVQK